MNKTAGNILLIVFFLGIVIGIHWLLYSLVKKQGMISIQNIEVTGNSLTRKKDIIRYSGLDWDALLFSEDLLQAAEGVEEHPLIDSAVVKRVPPQTMEIVIEERDPIATVSDGEDSYICDRKGNIIDTGTLSDICLISVDFSLVTEDEKISDEYITATLDNLADFYRRDEIENIVVKLEEGSYVILDALPDTLFFVGKRIVDEDYLERVVSIGDTIIEKELDISYVDVDETSGVGF